VADFIVVGAHALAAHGIPRATGDCDILVEPTPENAMRVLAALRWFGAPIETHRLSEADLSAPGLVNEIGLPRGASTSSRPSTAWTTQPPVRAAWTCSSVT
jgi:hypothetical protein